MFFAIVLKLNKLCFSKLIGEENGCNTLEFVEQIFFANELIYQDECFFVYILTQTAAAAVHSVS